MFGFKVTSPNFQDPKSFYYITQTDYNEGFFKLYGCSKVFVTSTTISGMPKSGEVFAVPRKVIDEMSPCRDFMVSFKLLLNDKHHNFGEISLEKLLTDTTMKYSEYFTAACLSAGEECIDMGDSLIMLSHGLIIPKFDDKEIFNKLTKCMHETIQKSSHYMPCQFVIKSDDGKLTMTVGLKVAKSLNEKLSNKSCGKFTIMEKKE